MTYTSKLEYAVSYKRYSVCSQCWLLELLLAISSNVEPFDKFVQPVLAATAHTISEVQYSYCTKYSPTLLHQWPIEINSMFRHLYFFFRHL